MSGVCSRSRPPSALLLRFMNRRINDIAPQLMRSRADSGCRAAPTSAVTAYRGELTYRFTGRSAEGAIKHTQVINHFHFACLSVFPVLSCCVFLVFASHRLISCLRLFGQSAVSFPSQVCWITVIPQHCLLYFSNFRLCLFKTIIKCLLAHRFCPKCQFILPLFVLCNHFVLTL